MSMANIYHRMQGNGSLRVIGYCGLAGILIDIDHPVAYFTGWRARFLHTPLLIISCLVLCGLGAYLGGLFYREILRRVKRCLQVSA